MKIVYIYADIDISVNVFFEIDTFQGNDPTTSFRSFVVNPVDTFGTEFQTVYKENAYCYPISLHNDVTCSIVYAKNPPIVVSGVPVFSGHSFRLENDTYIYTTNAITTAVTYRFDKPSTLFCSYKTQSAIQVPPLSSWSTRYLVPENLTQHTNLVFKLQLCASVDKTNVSVIPGNQPIYLRNKGDIHEIEINTTNHYDINASSPIAVGLEVSQSTHVRSFHMLPPESGFTEGGIFISVPVSPFINFNTSTLLSFVISSQRTTQVNIRSVDDTKFYQNGNEDGSSYGFSILQTASEDILVVPGYTRNSQLQQVKHYL